MNGEASVGRFQRVANLAMAICLGVMAVAVFINVVLRYGFNSGITISEELSRWLLVWLTFLGAIVAVREHAHGQAEERVEHGEREALQETDLGVADVHVLLQRPDEERKDLPVHVREGVAQRQHAERVPRDAPSRIDRWHRIGRHRCHRCSPSFTGKNRLRRFFRDPTQASAAKAWFLLPAPSQLRRPLSHLAL